MKVGRFLKLLLYVCLAGSLILAMMLYAVFIECLLVRARAVRVEKA